MSRSKALPTNEINRFTAYLKELGSNSETNTLVLGTRMRIMAEKITPASDEVIHLDATASFSGRDLCNAVRTLPARFINFRQRTGDVFRISGYISKSSVPPSSK
jgi:hypothetical protein